MTRSFERTAKALNKGKITENIFTPSREKIQMSPPGFGLGFLLWQAELGWQRRLKKVLEEAGVSHAQFILMATLDWIESSVDKNQDYYPTQIHLAQQTRLDKMSVSKALKALTLANCVQRQEHKEDTRAKVVTLTDKGRRVAKTLMEIVDQEEDCFFGGLLGKTQKNLLEGLIAVIQLEDRLKPDLKEE